MEEYNKVTISFTKEQLEKLDEIMSKEQGYSRSSLVREAVDYLHRDQGIRLSCRICLLCSKDIQIGILRMEQREDVSSPETERGNS